MEVNIEGEFFCNPQTAVVRLGKELVSGGKRKGEVDVLSLRDAWNVQEVIYNLNEHSKGKVYDSLSVTKLELRLDDLVEVPEGLEFDFENLACINIVNTSYRFKCTKTLTQEAKTETVLYLFRKLLTCVKGRSPVKVFDSSFPTTAWASMPAHCEIYKMEDYEEVNDPELFS